MNAEDAVITWLTGQVVVAIRVVSTTGITLASQCPLIKVTNLGGPANFTLGRPIVNVEFFSAADGDIPPRIAAMELAESIHTLIIRQMRGVVAGDSIISRTETVLSPSWQDYGDPTVARFVARYRVYLQTP